MTHGRKVYSLLAKNKYYAPHSFFAHFFSREAFKRAISESGSVTMSTLGAQSASREHGINIGKDFVILCPANTLEAALSALYYLPRNYKLVVRDQGGQPAFAHMLQDDAFMNRVSFEQPTGTSNQDAPVSFVDAVLWQEQDSLGERVTHHINLRDAATPEALASAILKAARI